MLISTAKNGIQIRKSLVTYRFDSIRRGHEVSIRRVHSNAFKRVKAIAIGSSSLVS